MTKKIFILTGAPNDRKSSTIRALTGVHDSKFFELEINDVKENVYVMTTSPNEVKSKRLPHGISPNDLVKWIKGLKKEIKIILPIRAINPLHELPTADEYIKILHKAGFEIAIVAMYNIKVNLPSGVKGILIDRTRSIAANSLAAKLRKMWKIN